MSAEDGIALFVSQSPYLELVGALVPITFKTLNYFLKRQELANNQDLAEKKLQHDEKMGEILVEQKDREIELEKEKINLSNTQQKNEFVLRMQLKKFDTLLLSQKYYFQTSSSASGLLKHLSDPVFKVGIKPFFQLCEFIQRRQMILTEIEFYFFSQRKAEQLVMAIERGIMTKIIETVGSREYTRLLQLDIADIKKFEEKCDDDPEIKQTHDKFLKFIDGDIESFMLYLELYSKTVGYLVNDTFKEWYQEDDEFILEHKRLRDEVNEKLKTDEKFKDMQVK